MKRNKVFNWLYAFLVFLPMLSVFFGFLVGIFGKNFTNYNDLLMYSFDNLAILPIDSLEGVNFLQYFDGIFGNWADGWWLGVYLNNYLIWVLYVSVVSGLCIICLS